MRGADLGASSQGGKIGGVGETSLSSPNLQGSDPRTCRTRRPAFFLGLDLCMQPHFATIRRRAGLDT